MLAAKRHQVFGMATVTANAQETVLEAPTFEVILELLLNIPGQGRALCRQVGLERVNCRARIAVNFRWTTTPCAVFTDFTLPVAGHPRRGLSGQAHRMRASGHPG